MNKLKALERAYYYITLIKFYDFSYPDFKWEISLGVAPQIPQDIRS